MTDRPILFSGPMVRALLEGRKTQTRRLAWRSYRTQKLQPLSAYAMRASPWQSVEPSDRLWVREVFGLVELPSWDQPYPIYRASNPDGWDEVGNPVSRWRPSIHMPRWASRLTLIVTDVRLQRLQEISGLDALAEGITREEGVAPWRSFRRLWISLHGKGSWDDNPEVVALTFTVHQENIDAMEKAA